MEIRVLNYFLAVVREGNITRAAEKLHITQPTLSRQLMQLEDELGSALFVRGKRKIILTEAGMILKRRAEEIVNLSLKTELEIGSQNDEINGEIAIACGLMQATQTMGIFIKKFQKIYPQVQFHFRNGNSDFVIENIENGLVDIGIVLEPVELEKLNSIRLKEKEKWGLLVKKNSPLSKKDYILASDLKDIPLINTARQLTQNHFKNWYGDNLSKLYFSASSELSYTGAMLTRNDIGHAILIEGSIYDSIPHDVCFKPFYPELSSHSLIVWKKYESLSLTVSKFIDFICDEIRENDL